VTSAQSVLQAGVGFVNTSVTALTAAVSGDISALNTTVEAIISRLQTSTSALNTSVNSLQVGVGSVNTSVSALNATVAALSAGLNASALLAQRLSSKFHASMYVSEDVSAATSATPVLLPLAFGVEGGPDTAAVVNSSSGSATVDSSRTGTSWGRLQLHASASAPSTFALFMSIMIWDCNVAGPSAVFQWQSNTVAPSVSYSADCVAVSTAAGRVFNPLTACTGLVAVPAGGTVSLDFVLLSTSSYSANCVTISRGGDNGSGWIIERGVRKIRELELERNNSYVCKRPSAIVRLR
jgi:hypothetical protein